ncbi:hypothetical protein K432DRAFT_393884 [Lepidopterella palustris CBS 459.81]|uniref:Uncharacterized protein n=1 Tax=Lepidopterella palustris CBS 459.81 TaxID=1314670 RepID=A0A8E2JE97_9PEZI|nr:hypothetical protein K432DRAFT_393884 [Lepidopterella palustris CBS 459.81]
MSLSRKATLTGSMVKPLNLNYWRRISIKILSPYLAAPSELVPCEERVGSQRHSDPYPTESRQLTRNPDRVNKRGRRFVDVTLDGYIKIWDTDGATKSMSTDEVIRLFQEEQPMWFILNLEVHNIEEIIEAHIQIHLGQGASFIARAKKVNGKCAGVNCCLGRLNLIPEVQYLDILGYWIASGDAPTKEMANDVLADSHSWDIEKTNRKVSPELDL